MSGQVHGPTPWTRGAIIGADPEQLARVQSAIPDGFGVTLFCHVKPRPLGAILWHGKDQVARVEAVHPSVIAAVEAVLRKAAVAA